MLTISSNLFPCILAISFYGISGIPLTTELDITIKLLDYFSIKKCTILLDHGDSTGPVRARTLSDLNVYSAIMNAPKFKEQLQLNKHGHGTNEIVTMKSTSKAASELLANVSPSAVSKVYWLIFVENKIPTLHRNIAINTLFYLVLPAALWHKGSTNYLIFEYFVMKNKYPRVHEIAKWTTVTGLVFHTNAFQNRRNFHGVTLGLLRPNAGPCVSEGECAHLDLWYSMGDMLNFSTAVIPENESFGTFPDASSGVTVFHSNGLVTDSTLLDSLAPIWHYTVYAYVKHENATFRASSFRQPFTTPTWMALLVCLTLTTLCIFTIATCSRLLLERNTSILQALFLASDAICNQCGHDVGSSSSKRIVAVFSRYLALTVIPAYAASITSILTLQHPLYPFTDLQGLVEDGTYKLTAVNDTFMVGYYQYSNNPLAQTLSTMFFEDQATLPLTTDEGIRKVCDRRLVLLTLENHLTGKALPCKLLRTFPAFRTYAGMHLAPGSPYRRIFFSSLIRFQTSGVLYKATSHKPPSKEIQPTDFLILNYFHVQPLLILLLFGIAIALIILGIEKYFYIRFKAIRFRKAPIVKLNHHIHSADNRKNYSFYRGRPIDYHTFQKSIGLVNHQ